MNSFKITPLNLILLSVFISFASCKKKKTDVEKPVSENPEQLIAISKQIAGNWRFTDFTGILIFHDPKNNLKSKPISVKDMLDSFNQIFGSSLKTDSLSFLKTTELGGLVYGRSQLVVFCPYATNGKADGAYTTYKIINDGGRNKVQIQWTYWNKNGSVFDTTHVVPYQLPISNIDNSNLILSIDQPSFNSYSLGTEQYGNTILMLLFSLTFPDEYKKLGFSTYTNDEWTKYTAQIYEVISPIDIKMTKIP